MEEFQIELHDGTLFELQCEDDAIDICSEHRSSNYTTKYATIKDGEVAVKIGNAFVEMGRKLLTAREGKEERS